MKNTNVAIFLWIFRLAGCNRPEAENIEADFLNIHLLLEKKFTCAARDGYIRDRTPAGEREDIGEAAYDFSDQLRPFNAGIELGANSKIGPHPAVSLNFNWALTPLMKSDFQSIDFNMYNLFGNRGLICHL